MSKRKKVSIPKQPEFNPDPLVSADRERLSRIFGKLTSGDLSGELSFLQPLTERDPEITRLALEQAQLDLQPAFQDILTEVQNRAVAAGQGTTSALTTALGRVGEQQSRTLASLGIGAALEDRRRALDNTASLFGLGLQTGQSGIGLGLTAQQQAFQAEQNRFENQLSANILNRDNRGGLVGGITGALGGAATGGSIGGPFGALIGAGLGGVAGATGPSGTGGQLLQAGGTFAGANPFGNIASLSNPFARQQTGAFKSRFNLLDQLDPGGFGTGRRF